MSENNMDTAVIKRTQDSLGKYVKKPPLTEKLLRKPPFRFLHDIFNVVIKDTGCFAGLYTPEELNFDNIKDRDDKMKFLQKMIDVVKLTTSTSLSVRASKIVAGHEPEKTNELLQSMGEIIGKKLDWQSAVEKVAAGKKDSKIEGKKSREDTKTKDGKPADRTSKERAKEKEPKSRDARETKDVKDSKERKIRETKAGVSKNISPTGKNERPIRKIGDSKEKEKAVVKPTKRTKEAGEKQNSITKSSTKVAHNNKSPSPIKMEMKNNRKISPDLKEPKSLEQTEEEENGIRDLELELENPIGIIPASSRHIDNSLNGLENGTEPTTLESDAKIEKRKSSGKVKSRHSSAHKTVRDEQEENSSSLGNPNSESLKTVNEEKSVAERPIDHKENFYSPSKITNNHNEVRRESTFTRAETNIPSPAPAPAPASVGSQKSQNNQNINNSTMANSVSGTGSSNNTSTNARPRTSLRPPSARPASARPGAPRRRDKNVEIVLQPNDQIKMSGINVKLETFGDFGDDDGENLVVIEDVNAALNETEAAPTETNFDGSGDLEQQGHLVQQILETQKELIQNGDITNQSEKKDTTNSSSQSGARQSSARQMDNLRDVIQNLTKSVNPFGKLMDFIPEDIDAMQLELSMWRESYAQAANELKRERSLTESTTEPMKLQLTQIEANIKEYLEMIDASRTKILQNSDKLIQMLTEQ